MATTDVANLFPYSVATTVSVSWLCDYDRRNSPYSVATTDVAVSFFSGYDRRSQAVSWLCDYDGRNCVLIQ